MGWKEDAERFRKSRNIVTRLESLGFTLELAPDGRDFEFWTEAGDIEPEVFREIVENRSLILEGLREWDKSLARLWELWKRYPSPCRILED